MPNDVETPKTTERIGLGDRDWTRGQIALWCAYILLALLVLGFEVLRAKLIYVHADVRWLCFMGFLIVLQILGVAAGLRATYPGKWLLCTATVALALLWIVLVNPARMMAI